MPRSTLTIQPLAVKNLRDSSRTYINPAIISRDLFLNLVNADAGTSSDSHKNIVGKDHDARNLAVGVCHAQQYYLLVASTVENSKAIVSPKTANITGEETPMWMLSAPGLNYAYGDIVEKKQVFLDPEGIAHSQQIPYTQGPAKQLSTDDEKTYLLEMYKNIFNAALLCGCEGIVMPAVGLGEFCRESGKEILHFNAIHQAAKCFPKLTVAYNPTIKKNEYNTFLGDRSTDKANNVIQTDRDVLFFAQHMQTNGHIWGVVNASDPGALYGRSDIGKNHTDQDPGQFAAEEMYAAVTTCAINSYHLNPDGFTNPDRLTELTEPDPTFQAPSSENLTAFNMVWNFFENTLGRLLGNSIIHQSDDQLKEHLRLAETQVGQFADYSCKKNPDSVGDKDSHVNMKNIHPENRPGAQFLCAVGAPIETRNDYSNPHTLWASGEYKEPTSEIPIGAYYEDSPQLTQTKKAISTLLMRSRKYALELRDSYTKWIAAKEKSGLIEKACDIIDPKKSFGHDPRSLNEALSYRNTAGGRPTSTSLRDALTFRRLFNQQSMAGNEIVAGVTPK